LSTAYICAEMEYVHRRVLSIHFRLIQKCIRNIASTLEANTTDRDSIFYSVSNNVDSESRKRMFKINAMMLDEIQKMEEELTLESEEERKLPKCPSSAGFCQLTKI